MYYDIFNKASEIFPWSLFQKRVSLASSNTPKTKLILFKGATGCFQIYPKNRLVFYYRYPEVIIRLTKPIRKSIALNNETQNESESYILSKKACCSFKQYQFRFQRIRGS